MIDRFFSWTVKNREFIITLFKVYYFLLIITLLIGGISIYQQDNLSLWFYSLGVNSGRAALVFYILTTIPGIARRFGLRHKLVSILMIFRRYIGISMYLHVTIHYLFVRGINNIRFGENFPSLSIFEIFGMTAALLAFPMFLTSNDRVVKHLGIWWDRIHKLTYVIIFLILLHVALQRVSIWSVFLGITSFFQLLSFIFVILKKWKKEKLQE